MNTFDLARILEIEPGRFWNALGPPDSERVVTGGLAGLAEGAALLEGEEGFALLAQGGGDGFEGPLDLLTQPGLP